jgi:putative FmdB family regulatory protein
MPIYDYLCSACDHRADILHGLHDPAPQFCPSCGAEGTMRKQFTAPTIHFKGTGWAKKDRGASARTKAAAKGSAGDGEGAKEASASGDRSAGSPEPGPADSPGSSSSASSPSEAPKPSTTD